MENKFKVGDRVIININDSRFEENGKNTTIVKIVSNELLKKMYKEPIYQVDFQRKIDIKRNVIPGYRFKESNLKYANSQKIRKKLGVK